MLGMLGNIPLWTIAQGKEELVHEKDEIQDFDDIVENRRDVVSKRPSFVFVRCAGCPDNVHDDRGSEPVRR